MEREGVLYGMIHPPGGSKDVFQILLPQCLREKVFQSVHDGHGHQGIDRTLQLIRDRGYCVIFGREPQPPVDFLLGVDKENLSEETPEEWVRQHQESLRMAHDHVRQQLNAKAEKRNQKYNQQVTDPDLEEGQLVYLRNHQVSGRNKIQDVWHPCLCRVVNRPQDQGAVYTIAPAHQDGPLRRVQRTELRRAPRREEPDAQQVSPPYDTDDSDPDVAAMSDSEESMILVFEDDGRKA